MAAQRPAALKKGDTILLIATARKVSRDEMRPAILQLEKWGLKVEEGPSLYNSCDQFAGTDDERATDLQWALDHPTASAVIIARGGYGTMRIIDRADFTHFERRPKWFIGYSDVTILHHTLLDRGFESLHGTMPINFGKNEEATDSLRKLLFGEDLSYSTAPHALNRPGQASGELVGGNLSLLYAMKGTAPQPDLKGKILFLEDLDEYLYHIDRMILSLKRAGYFKQLAGVIAGGMTEMKDNAVPFGSTAEEIIAAHLREYDFPICFNFPAGHIDRNIAFRHGADVTLKVTASGGELSYK